MTTGVAPTSAASDRFGPFGGRYVPETLIPALDELEVLLDVPVPVSSEHAPSAKSAHDATKIPDTPR